MKIVYFLAILSLSACTNYSFNVTNKSNAIFYVSPKGDDTNNGASPDTPFQTLDKAQVAMRNSNANKKIAYIMGGTYNIKAPLILTHQDAGQSWLGYPGETAILDGAGITEKAIFINSKNVTIRWLNIQNFSRIGIVAGHSHNIFIDSNTIKNIASDGWNQGGIVTLGNFTNGTISHNRIENSGYAGILSATSIGIKHSKNAGLVPDSSLKDDISNLTIDSNLVYNSCTKVNDCGAIYASDRGHASRNVKITNNVIKNYGLEATPKAWSIYLDDQMSNALVKNNISYGKGGEYAFIIHGGDHNLIKNNIFDISGAKMLGLFSLLAKHAPNYGMKDNIFTCNIIYSSANPPSALWNHSASNIAFTPYDNLYWSTKGTMPNKGKIIDSNPTFKDPNFVNTSEGNYNFKDNAIIDRLGFCPDFKPINTKNAGPLPNLNL